MAKSISNLSKAECKTVSEEAFSNAKRKIKLAEDSCVSKDYGSAISLLIIGSEELTKAFILYFDSLGCSFRTVKGLQSVFNNHNLRYFILFLLFSFGVFVDEINQFFKRIKLNKNPNGLLEELSDRINEDKEEFFNKTQNLIISKISFLIDEIYWFNNFDPLRQKGFYVDYNDKLETPMRVTKEDYLEIKMRVDRVKEMINELFESPGFNHESNKKSILDFVETMKKENYYQAIESFIEKVKENKTDPLNFSLNFLKRVINDLKTNKLHN